MTLEGYRDTCVVCLQATDTALNLHGVAEAAIAGLAVLGVPESQATRTLFFAWHSWDPTLAQDEVPDGVLDTMVRVCSECVRRTNAQGYNFPLPALAVPGALIPSFGPALD
jgi:hypothetical protein